MHTEPLVLENKLESTTCGLYSSMGPKDRVTVPHRSPSSVLQPSRVRVSPGDPPCLTKMGKKQPGKQKEACCPMPCPAHGAKRAQGNFSRPLNPATGAAPLKFRPSNSVSTCPTVGSYQQSIMWQMWATDPSTHPSHAC